ncbi:NlpC/P60 family protein [Pasteurella bettyae CCUG 2042]|uniref:NlpC/P60 family protein n=2 Tax=Pasteurellales TaxID=135625 RepID=I3DAL0_9PAST|nr:NlpC/P60 family protein [Pasteurella bettyae CCUG 2042]SUB20877.1 lipoprotein NlpC [Pasteurella bettyae]
MMIKKLLVIAGALFLAACSSAPRQSSMIYPSADERDDTQLTALIGSLKTNKPQYGARSNFNSAQHAQINNKQLMKVYNEWAGTRYRFGGTTSRGIDCSAFMQEAFASAFGISLPRSTSEQQSVGRRIQKNELQQGDLVFFRGNRHVGVYLGGNRFMHSSTTEGVTISSLDEAYWSRTYTQSRRVL